MSRSFLVTNTLSIILQDAIMMPICACPMCDECARDSLIESETSTCPACGEPDNSPDDLIPWRQMRDRVSYSFKCIICNFVYIR